MPRHRRAEDVGNLSGQPNPPLLTLVYVSTFKHACAQDVGRGAFSRNLSALVASPGGPRQVSVSGCISGAHANGRQYGSWGVPEPSISQL